MNTKILPVKEKKLPPIQSLWIGSSLGDMECLSVSSFLAHGHPYHLYVYSDVKRVPEGAKLMDANEIIPEKEVYKCQKERSYEKERGYAPFSDWFRWELMARNGGYWMDTDMICLKKIDLPNEFIMGKQDEKDFCTAAIRFPLSHPLVKAMARRCRYPMKAALYDLCVYPLTLKRDLLLYQMLLYQMRVKVLIFSLFCNKKKARILYGADLSSVLIMDQFLHSDIRWKEIREDEIIDLARTYFYPVPWQKYRTLIDDTYKDVSDPFPDSYAVHFWTDLYRGYPGGDKLLAGASPDSFYSRLKKRYL